MSRLVAATMRTSTRSAVDSPTRRTSPSCSVRSSLDWKAGLVSVTSSMKSVPPSASSKRPRRVFTAPVKAPLAWPNSSLSSSDSEMAAQLTGTKGRELRRLWACSARETSSLPVPLSP